MVSEKAGEHSLDLAKASEYGGSGVFVYPGMDLWKHGIREGELREQ